MPQSLAKNYIHLVFSTKNREPLILSSVRIQLHSYLGGILNNLDSQVIKTGGTGDHIHTIFRLSKNFALAKIVEEVKTNSSKWIKTQGNAFANFYWQSGYAGFSVSAGDADRVVDYIERQEEHHRVVSFQDEYRKLLQDYGIAFDERYVWD